MEPQLEGCGKRGGRLNGNGNGALQWSRNLRVVESGRPIRHGRLVGASMEPQLEGCGKLDEAQYQPLDDMLQWSRNLRVAESGGWAAGNSAGNALQWSRNLRVAESPSAPGVPVPRVASMEPQLEGCGKCNRRVHVFPHGRASMEPQLEGCGKANPAADGRPEARSFNGAAT